MKKEFKKQIKAAVRLTKVEGWNAIDGVTVDYVHAYPIAWVRNSNQSRRRIKAATKAAVKAFAKNADGSFRRCAVVRSAARRNLAEVIFREANG